MEKMINHLGQTAQRWKIFYYQIPMNHIFWIVDSSKFVFIPDIKDWNFFIIELSSELEKMPELQGIRHSTGQKKYIFLKFTHALRIDRGIKSGKLQLLILNGSVEKCTKSGIALFIESFVSMEKQFQRSNWTRWRKCTRRHSYTVIYGHISLHMPWR